MFAVDNVASVAYGIEGGSFNEDTQQLYKHGVEMMGQFLDNPFMVFLVIFFPKIVSLLGLLGIRWLYGKWGLVKFINFLFV